MTRVTMRQACGLPVAKAAATPPMPRQDTPAEEHPGGSSQPPEAPDQSGVKGPTQQGGSYALAPIAESLADRSMPQFVQSSESVLLSRHASLVRHCLAEKKDLVTAYMLTRMPGDVWPGVPPAQRLCAFEALEQAGYWKLLHKRGT